MRHLISALACTTVFCQAQAPEQNCVYLNMTDKAIGFISLIPKIKYDDYSVPREWSIPVSKHPTNNSEILTTITNNKQLNSMGIGYEEWGASVYRSMSGWYQVHTTAGEGWVNRKYVDRYLSVWDMICGYAHLGCPKDHLIYSHPNETSKQVSFPKYINVQDYISFDVKVVEKRNIKGTMWLKVNFKTRTICGSPTEFKSDFFAWVHAYDKAGNLVISWYDSC